MPYAAVETDIIRRSSPDLVIGLVSRVLLHGDETAIHQCFLHAADGIEAVAVYRPVLCDVAILFVVSLSVRTRIAVRRYGIFPRTGGDGAGLDILVPSVVERVVVQVSVIYPHPPVVAGVSLHVRPFVAQRKPCLVFRIAGRHHRVRATRAIYIARFDIREVVGLVCLYRACRIREPAPVHVLERGRGDAFGETLVIILQVRRANVYVHLVAQHFTLHHRGVVRQSTVCECTTAVTFNTCTMSCGIQHLRTYFHRSVHYQRSVLQISLRRSRTAVIMGCEVLVRAVVIRIHTVRIPVIRIVHIHFGIDIQCRAVLHFHHRTRMRRHRFGNIQRVAALQDDMHVGRYRQVVVR